MTAFCGVKWFDAAVGVVVWRLPTRPCGSHNSSCICRIHFKFENDPYDYKRKSAIAYVSIIICSEIRAQIYLLQAACEAAETGWREWHRSTSVLASPASHYRSLTDHLIDSHLLTTPKMYVPNIRVAVISSCDRRGILLKS